MCLLFLVTPWTNRTWFFRASTPLPSNMQKAHVNVSVSHYSWKGIQNVDD